MIRYRLTQVEQKDVAVERFMSVRRITPTNNQKVTD